MKFEFTLNAWEDIEYWIDTDPEMIQKIKDLL
jgi:Txe/YoeB family toxin of Txe-Axe toxin-antitoxin module